MKKLIMLSLVGLLLFTSSYDVKADLINSTGASEQDPFGGHDETQNKDTTYDKVEVSNTEYSTTSEVKVYATKASSVTYKIPQVIVGDSNGTAHYMVGVKGDISATQKINISAPDTFILTDGVRNVTATISQDKSQWVYTDLIVDNSENDGYSLGSGDISYTLPAGSFSGSFSFDISITNN